MAHGAYLNPEPLARGPANLLGRLQLISPSGPGTQEGHNGKWHASRRQQTSSRFHTAFRLSQGQTEAAAELYQRAAAGADCISALLKPEPGSLQSPLHAAELRVDALLGHAQTLAASQRCGCFDFSKTELPDGDCESGAADYCAFSIGRCS